MKDKREKTRFKLNIIPAPHRGSSLTTLKMMRLTLAALFFPAAGGIYFFGIRVFYLLLCCLLSSLFFEYAALRLRNKEASPGSFSSAAVSGAILALVLPPGFPLWGAVIGSAFSILIVKHVFGGLGKNIFNPALAGRAFLAAAFPLIITQYSIMPRQLPEPVTSLSSEREAVTRATPLNRFKFEGERPAPDMIIPFFLGEKKGSSGETSGLLILIGLGVLLISGAADWRLPVSFFSSVFIFSGLLWLFFPQDFLNPIFGLMLGGVLLGGVFMVTDPATTPATPGGKILFGAGAGVLSVLIRTFSGYPEGLMFAILIMNAVTPLINRYIFPRIYGTS